MKFYISSDESTVLTVIDQFSDSYKVPVHITYNTKHIKQVYFSDTVNDDFTEITVTKVKNFCETKELFSIVLNNGNVNCFKCTNCYGCMNCVNCNSCMASVNCKDCTSCARCTGCKCCFSCNTCNRCDRSSDCYNCNNCRYCRNCKRCNNCMYCRNCSNCKNLNNGFQNIYSV